MNPQHSKPWRSRRLATADYTAPGSYFVTICTRNRQCIFGNILNGPMTLSTAGEIADRAWHSLPNHFHHITLGPFVIMPNHLHAILIFDDAGHSLGTVVGGFKSEVSRRIGAPAWQRYFYDHIIRNEKDFNEIRLYIENNPLNWPTDEDNPEHHIPAASRSGQPTRIPAEGLTNTAAGAPYIYGGSIDFSRIGFNSTGFQPVKRNRFQPRSTSFSL